MNMEQVALLFGLFAGPDVVAEEYTPILTMAVQEVRQGLLPDAENTDAKQKRDFALSLVWAYRGLCRSLLEEGTFFFAAV